MKLRHGRGKHLLRKAVADLLPPEILVRPKMGFGVPISRWFRTELRSLLQDTLGSNAARQRGWFETKAVEGLCREHLAGRGDHGYRLWALLTLELWAQRFLD
jgi:asparagine synthase (glutamine-hydrolysing)